MTDPHPGSRACYQKGCRALECRVANAAYQQIYRVKRRQGIQGVVNGRQTSRMLIGLKAEGFTGSLLARLAGLSRATWFNHLRSRPVRQETYARVKLVWDDVQGGAEPTLDRSQQKVVESMLNSLARDWQTEAQAWQNIRSVDDDA